MKEKLNFGIIGLGGRGRNLTRDTLVNMPDVNIVAICDVYEDRCEEVAKIVEDAGRPRPRVSTNYHDILAMDDVDTVLITAAWETHIRISCEAMRAGKAVGFEVGGCYAIEDCWQLIHTHEETGMPCAMLENSCFDRDELMVLNMVRQGLFGEIVHCEGGYRHDLRHEVSRGRENRHYRFRNYLNRCADNYPTHDLGPISSILDINHGNRILSLVSMASKSCGLHDFILADKGRDYDAADFHFAQGDVVTTILKCAHGETITLTLDTTLPRYYSRCFQVQGTKAMYEEENRSICTEKEAAFEREHEGELNWREYWGNADEYHKDYDHPLWKKFLDDGVQGGHGGCDWLEFRNFVENVKRGRSGPVDVYDAATWIAVTTLTEQSIAMGGMPQVMPDFTSGRWISRPKWNPVVED